MMRISDVLRALEDRGASLTSGENAMVWIDQPDAGCFVRAGDIRRIEAYYRGKSCVWSKVVIARPDGTTEILVDTRRPKSVRSAVERAELAATAALFDVLRQRFSA